MSIKAEAKESRFDALKWLVVVVLVAVGVVANHYFAAQSILYRVVGLLVLAAIAAFVALQTAKGQAFFGLLKKDYKGNPRFKNCKRLSYLPIYLNPWENHHEKQA